MKADTVRSWLQLLPTWLVLGVLFLAPMAIMLGISFREKGPAGTVKPVEDAGRFIREGTFLKNYRESLDPLYAGVYWRSLWVAVVTTALCLLIGYPAAYYIAVVAHPRWRNLLLAMVAIPFWTSFLVRMGAWKLILGTQGVLNTLLGGVGMSPWELLYTPTAVLIGLVYGELPFMILPLYASLEKMDLSLLEAAADLGAGPVGRFFRVTIPQTMPGIVAGVILVFIPAAGQFVVSDILGGAKGALVGNVIYEGFQRNKPLKSAIAFELTAVVTLMLVVYAFYLRRSKRRVL
ncbi:MAG TPA: ABC transporter permease [Tepidisphaeraceae bacterium]|jgi:spermidine/putrescine transport system permease protein